MTITIENFWERSWTDAKVDAKRAEHTWLGKTSNRYTRAKEVIAYGRSIGMIPYLLDEHPDEPLLTCRSVTATGKSGAPQAWDIRAEYSSEPLNEKEEEKTREPNPLLRKARIRWKQNRYRQAVFEGKEIKVINAAGTEVDTPDGNAWVNSAGDFLDPPNEKDRSFWAVSITKNVASIPSWILDIDNPLNSSTTTIDGLAFPRGTLKLVDGERSELQTEGTYEYYVLQLEIEYRKDGHFIRALDQGFRERGGTNERQEIKDRKGQKITSPWPLNGFGDKIDDPNPSNVYYIQGRVDEYFDFNNFPLT